MTGTTNHRDHPEYKSCIVCREEVLHDQIAFRTQAGALRFVWKGRAHSLHTKPDPARGILGGAPTGVLCESGCREGYEPVSLPADNQPDSEPDSE